MVGPSGSGKSTFAKELFHKTSIPIYHLDNIFWNANKTHITKKEFDVKLKNILTKDKWIIDGDYSRTYEERFKESDTIFFLDYPLELCLTSIESRIGKKRDDIPFIESEFEEEFREWINSWYKNTKPKLISLISKYKNTKKIFIFKSREEATDYLNNLKD